MTFFETVRITLDELYSETVAEHGDDADNAIKENSSMLSKSYSELDKEDRPPINYSDPATRFAYVYKYTAAHGDYTFQAFRHARSKVGSQIFSDKNVRVTCIGGGPGSDIIGTLKYLSEYEDEPVEKIVCYLLDGEQAWADTWTEVGDSLTSDIALNVHFQKLDVTDPQSWTSQKKFLQADVFTLSYFVSEIYSFSDNKVIDFWKKIIDEAKIGALIVYVDNGHETFNKYFDAQWSKRDDVEMIVEINNTRTTPGYSEQASELNTYKQKFGDNPKVQSWISTRVLRKVKS